MANKVSVLPNNLEAEQALLGCLLIDVETQTDILDKLSEDDFYQESHKLIIGAMKGSREETIYELADLCYHALVLMVEEGISPEDIRAELASRHVIDHKVKQETMK